MLQSADKHLLKTVNTLSNLIYDIVTPLLAIKTIPFTHRLSVSADLFTSWWWRNRQCHNVLWELAIFAWARKKCYICGNTEQVSPKCAQFGNLFAMLPSTSGLNVWYVSYHVCFICRLCGRLLVCAPLDSTEVGRLLIKFIIVPAV